MFKQRPEGCERVSQGDDQRKNSPGRGKSKCKGPEVSVACVWNSKKTSGQRMRRRKAVRKEVGDKARD